MRREDREARDELLLATLDDLSFGEEWVEADAVCRRSPLPGMSPVGVGLVLSRLAAGGRCDVRLEGYMNRHRSRPERRQ